MEANNPEEPQELKKQIFILITYNPDDLTQMEAKLHGVSPTMIAGAGWYLQQVAHNMLLAQMEQQMRQQQAMEQMKHIAIPTAKH